MLPTALLWLLVLEVFSLTAYPIAHRAFSRLPDRGWSLSKPLGLLLVGFATWYVGLTHTISNSRWSVIVAWGVVAGIAWLATRGRWAALRADVRGRASTIISAELVFLTVFLGVTLLRAAVPDIAHTEQPMDLMFLNATVVSPHYPPADPWLAGQPVAYYYLGYLMIGAVSLLTGIATPIAYNLGLATFAAMAGIAAFGLTFNLVRLARGSLDGATLAGLTTVFLLLVASNLSGALELGRTAGAGGPEFWEGVGIEGLATAGDTSSVWYPDEGGWWWWRASRVIPGAVTEFPSFSLILGDMHPHVMSLGFLLLVAGVAIQIYLQPGLLRSRSVRRRWPLMLVAVAATGGLAAVNLWDVPAALAMVVLALAVHAARHEREVQFGAATALRDGEALVGVPGDPEAGPNAGRAFVYRRRGRRWKRTSELRPLGLMANAAFGTAVDWDGDIAVIGAPGAYGAGAAYIYERSEDGWAWSMTLRAPGATSRFGRSVAVEGQTIVVGAKGSAFAFRREARRWSAGVALEPQYPAGDFGVTVAASDEIAAVGAPSPGGGSIQVYHRAEAAWPPGDTIRTGGLATGIGRSLALDHGLLAAGGDGVAAVFHQVQGHWIQHALLEAPSAPSQASFGSAVTLNQGWLVVGAHEDRAPALASGAAYVYRRNGTEWEAHARLKADDAGTDGAFGSAVSIAGETVLAGAPGSGNGGAYTFTRALDDWLPGGKIVGRWRLGRVFLGAGLLLSALIIAMAPFLMTFEGNAQGVLPLRGIATRPVHLLLLWGVSGFLVVPFLVIVLRDVFRGGNWSTMRMGVTLFLAFGPLILWLQPLYGIPFYLVALLFNGLVIFLFGLHRAGYRLPRVDEMSFAVNAGVTRIVGTALLVSLLLYDGIAHGERGVDGRNVSIDRLMIVVPMAIVVTLAGYGAWTLAHRDSESAKTGRQSFDAMVPALLLLALASALIMGVELFHVVDAFGGGLRRFNTVFKLYYQAGALMAVLGGFGLWLVATKWNRRIAVGRIGLAAWGTVLVVLFGAVSYYPLAAFTTRASDASGFTLDGQAFLEISRPAEHEAIAWIKDNTPRDAVVLEAAVIPCGDNPDGCSAFTEAGRISSSTGRATILGWEQHEAQWRRPGTPLGGRKSAVRVIYESTDIPVVEGLLRDYGVDYVVVGTRERLAYGDEGAAKFAEMGTMVFDRGDQFRIYQLQGTSG